MPAAWEAKFWRQEHRLTHVVYNFIRRRSLSKDDPRREAAVWALVFRLFAPSTIVLGGGGVVALLTLLEMSRQTSAIIEQNQHFQAQIELEREQDYRTGKAQLISIIYGRRVVDGAWDYVEPRRARVEAAAALVLLERARDQTANLSAVGFAYVDMSGVDLSGTNLSRAELREADLSGADLSDANLSRVNMVGGADLSAASLVRADLSGALAYLAILRGADLTEADLTGARLGGADLRGATLSGTVLAGADLSDANLREVSGWSTEQLASSYWNEDTAWPAGFTPPAPARRPPDR